MGRTAVALDYYQPEHPPLTHKPAKQNPLKDLTHYPAWAQEMVAECATSKARILDHEFWKLMKGAQLDFQPLRNFLIGAWPIIDQFPLYMGMNLLKAPYGHSRGQDMARRWLIHNIRIEQNHAMYWINWAVASGIKKAEVINGDIAPRLTVLSHWCWHVCERDSLPAAMAATNYAIEGVSGEWAAYVISTPDYANSFPQETRRKAMHWLKAHATYDDSHPWEALEIICALLGDNPSGQKIAHVRQCVEQSYEYYRLGLDYCFES